MSPEDIDAIAVAVADKLSQSAEDLDWSKISVPQSAQPRPQCAKLNDVRMAKLLAVARLGYDNAMAQVLRTAIEIYLRQVWPKYVKDMRAIAAKEGITAEEVFMKIVKGDT